jgi:DNA polymerase-3 subunit delta
MTITLVQGSDPSLRDREVQRVVDELLGGTDRSLALDDHTIEGRRRGGASAEADAVEDTDDDSSGASLELPTFAAVVNAVQSPPFMTDCRVVVVREIGNLTSDQGKWLAEWMADPLDGVHLVLVAGGGRVPVALTKACKASATVVGDTKEASGEQTAAVLASAAREAKLRLNADASALIVAHLGADAGRVPELVELLSATYGPDATLDADAVHAYLGDVGTAERFALTNAIDRGELGAALEVLHRMLTATSASQPKPLHPMQVMASLVFHYQRLLKLDDPAITTNEQAAATLGMKSAYGARFPFEAARRLGSDGLREALGLLAQAELDLRGASGLDERTAIDVLVARLAALSRRHARGTTRARASRT